MEKEWVSKMGTFVGTLLCILILPVVVINCTLLFKSHINRERVPNIAGTFPMVVLTDSMYPEFQAGDLIFCHTKSASDVRPGDVIAFFDPAGNGKSIVTHRVESITTDENGSLAWVTKGDAKGQCCSAGKKSGRCIPQADPGTGKCSGLYADVKRNDGLCCVPDPSVCYV